MIEIRKAHSHVTVDASKMAKRRSSATASGVVWTKNAENIVAAMYREKADVLRPRFSGSISHDNKHDAWDSIVRAVNR